MQFDLDDRKYQHVHFIGIGGISMSALAEVLLNMGYHVSGSDSSISDITARLEKLGANIFQGHRKENLYGADLVIYTDAISLDNEELTAAIHQKIDLMDRASFLGQIMKQYKRSIAVSGTHGKTTTTSMITTIIKDLPQNPTILLGGNLDEIQGNVRIGDRELFLTEACEYKGNILKYFPSTAIVLNMDEDHLDYFDNMEHIQRTFRGYVENVGAEGTVILNIDDPYVEELLPYVTGHSVTFSTKSPADYEARDILYVNGCATFDLFKHGEKIERITLEVMGLHNVYNALGAIAACFENHIPRDTIISGIEAYHGVHRRLEQKGIKGGILVIDDYAHHPTEISSALHALKATTRGTLLCVFQPHTFTRTELLLDQFSASFHEADDVIITDIYAAREKDYGTIHSRTLTDAINEEGDLAEYISGFEDIVERLENTLKPGDTLVTMGAGDVWKIGEMYLADHRRR